MDDHYRPVHSPEWSADGSKIYLVMGEYNGWYESEGPVYSIDLATKDTAMITEGPIGYFDISPKKDIAATEAGWRFWFWYTDTWERIGMFKPCQKAIDNELISSGPVFSYESEDVVFYSYLVFNYGYPDTAFLNRINLKDSTDTEILISISSKTVLAPGPGDSLIAMSDTIFNLNSGEKIPLKVKAGCMDWNPADPTQLLIVPEELGDMYQYIFDLETRKLQKIDANTESTNMNIEARFSPDGKTIALAASNAGDGEFYNQLWLIKLPD